MEVSQIIPHIEALIFASEKPLTSIELADLVNTALGFIEDRATIDQIDAAINGIREKYATAFYPFEVRQSGGGWQFLTKADYHKTIAQLNGDKFLKRLSAAAMETLAIIAYKQPITKGEVESIRGVNCDYVVQKLLEKDLVVITGRNEELPGKPLIYATSKSFMDYFGINTANDLPKIKEILAEQVVQPTLVNAEHFEVEAESNLIVAENGELVQVEEGDVTDPQNDESPEIEITSIENVVIEENTDIEKDNDVEDKDTATATIEESNFIDDSNTIDDTNNDTSKEDDNETSSSEDEEKKEE